MPVMFSIVVCTHNPDQIIFRRLLNALQQQKVDDASRVEIIVVDNNSSSPVCNLINQPLFSKSGFKIEIVEERNPGLSNARIAGARKAKGEWIIFFDDDNEPATDYVHSLKLLISRNNKVGCWGPGVVEVEYIGKKISGWYRHNRHFFQQKCMKVEQIGFSPAWLDCYPFGTGLCIKRELVLSYSSQIVKGKFTLSDRIGKKLVSGGDTQMVLHAVKKGFYAGTSPKLQLNHLIKKDKLRFRYLLSQEYMTASCFVKAYNEIGFDKKIELDFLTNRQILRKVYSYLKIHSFKMPAKNLVVSLYGKLGEINARYYAAGAIQKPVVLRFFEKMINV